MKWLILAFGVLASASASLLIKVAVTPPRRLFDPSAPLVTLTNGPLLLGLTLYGVAFALYALTLVRLPLSIAHPVMTAGGVIVVAIGSQQLLREPFHWSLALGIVLVTAGVFIITTQASQ
ncbi:small multidrug resistance pump [Metapseudomonas resinovorans]|uniref:multidrug transporter n=1 Tax=Metapseudomonas resinovorans TaxID=53412 RepID=UPI003D1DD143